MSDIAIKPPTFYLPGHDEKGAKSNYWAFRSWHIGGSLKPYLKRWFLIPHNRRFNIFLHKFCRSDDDRALHDHPANSLGFIIWGTYIEHLEGGIQKKRWPLQFVYRPATHKHRIELIDDKPVYTIFITGPKIRDWGFHCPNGWKIWHKFDKEGCS